MSGVATAIVGGSIVTGLIGANASSKAASAQAHAADAASQVQWDMFQQNREDQEPWRKVGSQAIGRLSDLTQTGQQFGPDAKFTYNDLYMDPSYDFRLNQGLQAIQRSAASKGGLLSGGTLKGLNDYAQQAASQEYGNAYNRWNTTQSNNFNRLASLAGLGQSSAQSTGQMGTNAAGNIGNFMTQAGNAQAAGTVGQANAFTGAVNNGMNTWMQYKMLQKL